MATLFSDILTQRKFKMRLQTKGWRMKGCRVSLCVCVCSNSSGVYAAIYFILWTWMWSTCDFCPIVFEHIGIADWKPAALDGCVHASMCTLGVLVRYFGVFAGWSDTKHTVTLPDHALEAWAALYTTTGSAEREWETSSASQETQPC